ncbi:MAG: DUF2304 domain-containing protein [Nitrospinae bacterium]|nr:DUF2304 domain-containing protein [Nitrospinota bacterium]
MLKIQIVVAIMSLSLLLCTFELIRRGKLQERYAILWLFTGGVILLISIFPRMVDLMSAFTGMHYLTSIFAITFLFLLLIVLHFSTVISQLSQKNKDLAQECALSALKIKKLEEKVDKLYCHDGKEINRG